MKNLLRNLIVLFCILGLVESYAAELTNEKEQQLIKNLEQTKLQTGNASVQYLNALTELGEAYENDPLRREQYKNHMVNLIKYLRTTFGENVIDGYLIQSMAKIFVEDDDYDSGLKFFEEYRASLNPHQYDDLTHKKIRDDLNLLKFAYIESSIALMFGHKKDVYEAETIYKKYLNAFDYQDEGEVRLLHVDFLYQYSILKGGENERNNAANLALKSYEIIKTIPNLNASYFFQILSNVVSSLEMANRNDEYKKYLNVLKESYALNKESLESQVEVSVEFLVNQNNNLDQGIINNEKVVDDLERSSKINHNLFALRTVLGVQYLKKLEDETVPLNQKEKITKKGLNLFKKNILQSIQHPNVDRYSLTQVNLYMLTIFQIYHANDNTSALTTLHLSMAINKDESSVTAMQMGLLSTLYADINESGLAIFWGKQAVNAFQSVKYNGKNTDLIYLNENDKARQEVFPVLAGILTINGRILEAQQVLQMLKENELYETLRSTNDDPRKMHAELTTDEQANLKLYKKLADKEFENLKNVQFKDYGSLEKEYQTYRNKIETELKFQPARTVKNELNTAFESLALRKAIRQLAISEPQSHAVGIQYYVSKDKLNIVITPANKPPVSHQIKIDVAQFNRNIHSVLLQIENRNADAKYYSPALKELYALLITPILPDLRKYKAKTLMLSLNGQIRLLPFAALMDSNNHYFLENYTVALYNEAANQTLEKPSNPKWRIAAMGLSKSVNGLKALTAVPSELEGILKTSGLEGDEYLDATFTRRQFIKVTNATGNKPYNVLHVASHFELQPSDPSESSLYMGDGTKFSLKEMSAIPLNFTNFDLVTYSACQTAVTGSGDGSGKEIESLSAQTQRQGAQAVMATLWKVSDQSTAKLMQDYYARRNQGSNKAEALRAVQLNMALGKAGYADWKSPHHWAGFVISGNWR